MKIEIKNIENGLKNPEWPLLIAGPCSAESEEQMMKTALGLKNTERISFFRAGVWKPRTRPNSFEGVGEIGLTWLEQVKKETGLRVATEVATAEHTELALKHGIDLIWIGARSVTNPFSVQEIADVLKNTDATVLVKNPVNPDLQLWLGALERMAASGIKRLGAVHRGFSSYDNTVFRNAPMWTIPLELKAMWPELPVICDPSHICGRVELIPFIAQKAMDLEMNGLMIESHENPACALSDAKQQLTPDQYGNLILDIILRDVAPTSVDVHETLSKLRKIISECDEDIIQKLALRMKTVAEVGCYKKANHLTILQQNRWQETLVQRLAMSSVLGLNEDFVDKLLELIHQESINIQADIMNKEV